MNRLPPDELEDSLRALPNALRTVRPPQAWAAVWAKVRAPRSAWDFPLTRASASLAMLTLVLVTLWPAGIRQLGMATPAQIGVALAPVDPAHTQVVGDVNFKLTSPATMGAEAAATPQPITTPSPHP